MAPTHRPEEYDPNRCSLVMLADLLVPLRFGTQWYSFTTSQKKMIRTGVVLLRLLVLSMRPLICLCIPHAMAPTHRPEEYDPNGCGLVTPPRSVCPPLYASRHPEEYDRNRLWKTDTFATTTFSPPSTTHDSALASRFINNNERRAPPESSTRTSRETAHRQVDMSRPPPSAPTPKPGMFYMSVVVTTAPYLHPQPDLDGAHDRDRSTKIPADSHRQTERVVSPQPDDYATPWIQASSARFQRPRKPLNLLHNPTLAPTASSTTSGGMSSQSASTSRRRPHPCLR
ncbi:hypothetical protein DFJ58DRAFT_725200 [Suillus subalutaceus]|uniref:uncharacterized protein n=1 Tax=Suillus subalutaceus TaxID=48586 RepID=UPI001B8703E7|nr:uncharacterized protein DFJ58DRAFT_725200 [Suillus subalutaceus]KAG1862714.1 hypothetical protein DFJ58DRAFT_725200 [Suillus subalutaceus]